MELINQTKTVFKIGKDKKGNDITFGINKVISVDESLGKTLLRYDGVNTLESLKIKSEKVFADAKAEADSSKSEIDLLKEEAVELGLEFAGNISKAKLKELIEEAKTTPDSDGE